jgi:hypothetical protein
VDEDSPASSPDAVITWRTLPAVCAAACAVFVIIALVVSSTAEGIMWGAVALFFAAGAVYNYRRRYEVSQGDLLIQRTFTSQKVILSELVSVEAIPMRSSRGRVFWHLVLEDRRGTRVRMSFLHTAPGARQHFLKALMPFASAPDVYIEGPVDRAMAGTLW